MLLTIINPWYIDDFVDDVDVSDVADGDDATEGIKYVLFVALDHRRDATSSSEKRSRQDSAFGNILVHFKPL